MTLVNCHIANGQQKTRSENETKEKKVNIDAVCEHLRGGLYPKIQRKERERKGTVCGHSHTGIYIQRCEYFACYTRA